MDCTNVHRKVFDFNLAISFGNMRKGKVHDSAIRESVDYREGVMIMRENSKLAIWFKVHIHFPDVLGHVCYFLDFSMYLVGGGSLEVFLYIS